MPRRQSRASRFRTGQRMCPGLVAWELLGDGGRFESWLAWSVPLWSHVVVKLPRPELCDDVRSRQVLAREGRTLGRLSHPGIQRLLQDAHDRPVPHLVLGYVEGPTLAMLVDQAGPLDPIAVEEVGVRLAACLRYAHGTGLVHLDLKPGNVALERGHPVLLDFEIARPVGRPAPRGRPQGTRPYMAPEQCLGAPADPRMDLFALGAVLYELATGQPAFDRRREAGAPEFPQLLRPAAPARFLRPNLPAQLDAAIQALLERDPARRPPTAMDALRLLARAQPAGEDQPWLTAAARRLQACG